MLLNFGKCKCLHTGQGNLDVNYKIGDTVLGTTVKEKGLGVTISADMKVSDQCGIAASKDNQSLGLIRRTITYKEKELIIPVFTICKYENIDRNMFSLKKYNRIRGHEVSLVKIVNWISESTRSHRGQ